MYCLYVVFNYTHIDINALTRGIKSFFASQVLFQAVAGARTYDTDSPAITSMYVYMYLCMYVCMWMDVCTDGWMHVCIIYLYPPFFVGFVLFWVFSYLDLTLSSTVDSFACNTHTHTHTRTHAHTHTHTHTHTHVYIVVNITSGFQLRLD